MNMTRTEGRRRESSHAKSLNTKILEEAERRQNIQRILKERQAEFLSIVESYLKKQGGLDKFSNLLQVSDFKQILQAFGLQLTPQVSGNGRSFSN